MTRPVPIRSELCVAPASIATLALDASSAPSILTVPGLHNSDPLHWQSLWERERDDCTRADLGAWHDPTPDQWLDRLDRAVRDLPGAVVLVAHSLGCIAAVRWVAQCRSPWRRRVTGALLVAPCDPERAGVHRALKRFAPVPADPLPFRTFVVASEDDPYASFAWSQKTARAWAAEFVNAGRAGHINARSGLASWRHGQELLNRLMAH